MSVTDSIRDQATRWFIARGHTVTLGSALAYLSKVKHEHVDVVIAAWRAEMAKSGSYREAGLALVVAVVEGIHKRRTASVAA